MVENDLPLGCEIKSYREEETGLVHILLRHDSGVEIYARDRDEDSLKSRLISAINIILEG